MRSEEFSQIAVKINELNELLAEHNMEVFIESKASSPTPSFSTPVAQNRKSGFSQYWDIVDKIAKKEGITKHAARALYEAKKADFVTLTNGESVSKGMKLYWDKVRAIAAEKGISTKEARKLLLKPQPVPTNTVNV